MTYSTIAIKFGESSEPARHAWRSRPDDFQSLLRHPRRIMPMARGRGVYDGVAVVLHGCAKFEDRCAI